MIFSLLTFFFMGMFEEIKHLFCELVWGFSNALVNEDSFSALLLTCFVFGILKDFKTDFSYGFFRFFIELFSSDFKSLDKDFDCSLVL